MESNKLAPAILNLTGELSPALEEYFSSRKMKVVDPLVAFEELEWTHILAKDVVDFSLLAKTYKTLEKDIKLVSLSRVLNLQNFTACNGKLVMDEIWLQGQIGTFILDKFFNEFTNLSLADNYPEFEEKGSFKVTNPFNTGEYLDQMVHHAFEAQVPALTIKTYFDHLIMYLNSLKKRDKAGLPFEVSYGDFGGVFGVQISLLTKTLMLEDVHSSLSSELSKESEKYFLNIAVHSADFFDFTYLPEVTKTVITGLWTNDERIKYENRGLLFSHQASDAIQLYTSDDGAAPVLLQQVRELTDHTDEITQVVSGGTEAEPEVETIKGQEFNESLAEKISSAMEIEKIKAIIAGTDETDDYAATISGGEEVSEEVVSRIKSNIDEEKGVFRVSGGGQFDADKFAMRVSSGVGEKWNKDSPMMVKRLEQLPKTIKTGLFDFAKRLGKEVESLSDDDIDIFKDFEIPKLVNPDTDHLKSLNIRPDLENFLKEEFQVENLESIAEKLDDPVEVVRVREALKNSLQKSLDDKFKLSSKKELSNREKEVLVKTLTTSLVEEEDKMREIVEIEKEKHVEAKPLFKKTEKEKEQEKEKAKTEEKLRKLEKENILLKVDTEKMKTKADRLAAEVRILKESKKQLAEINKKTKAEAEAKISAERNSAVQEKSIVDEPLKKKVEEHKELVKEDYQKISELMNLEAENKKLQFEMEKKDSLFTLEFEKVQRQLKAKDMAVDKAKEALTKLAQRREAEVAELRAKLEGATKAIQGGAAQNTELQLKKLERDNASMNKMLEMYKDKLSTMSNKVDTSQAVEGSSKDEARKLLIQNAQYKNMLEANKRELSKLQERVSADSTMIINLKQEKVKLEQELKLKGNAHRERSHTADHNSIEIRRLETKNSMIESQLKETARKLQDTENKLAEAIRAQKTQAAVTEDPNKGRMNQLETALKKVTQDMNEKVGQLTEAKKDANKLRQEKNALQNQLDRVKKDLEKAMRSSPAKGGKKAS
jgi:hypothetical protein